MPTLSEHESKRLLAAHGIPVPDERLVSTPEAAAEAADALGYPVALKLCGRALAHKSERGLVKLGVAERAAVLAQARELFACAQPGDGEVALLVAPMLRGRRELIAGLVRDAQFGPCVMFGLGGIFAEALDDVAFAAAPLAPGDAEDLIGALAHAKLLGAFRGEPAVDRDALARVLEALAQIGVDRPDVRSIDLNPLILVEGRPVVADALVELSEGNS